MFAKPLSIAAAFLACAIACSARSSYDVAAVDAYLQPHVHSGNFSGAVLVEKNGKVVFQKAYGLADRERGIPNALNSRFHIASMSMQFTAAAILKLADTGALRLDDHVGDFLPEIPGAEKITIRDLLVERSGLPDINAFPDYADVLQHHQTPASLIAKIQGRPLLFEPGTKFLHEEHSAYNLLALIVEKKTGRPFAESVDRLFFRPAGLKHSVIDDDSLPPRPDIAKGYEPQGAHELKAATPIHWSAKTGNASAVTTVRDEARWVDALFRGRLLSKSSRQATLDPTMRVGYGWFKSQNQRFGQMAYYMNGRAPGFASFVLYLPDRKTTVVVLSNIYSSATTAIGYDVAALALGLDVEPLRFRDSVTAEELKSCTGTFQFEKDFYQAEAKLELTVKGGELSLHWPSGEDTILIPLQADHFVDRSYWVQVEIKRDRSGQPSELIYDHFEGKPSS